jgi:hypothetical protein
VTEYPRPRRAPRARAADVSGPVTLAVVGESHYQDALRALAGPKRPGGVELRERFRLVPEPDNAYDPDAVVVRTTAGETVGYVPRADAPWWRTVLPPEGAECDGVVLGGDADRDTGFGVWLHVRER